MTDHMKTQTTITRHDAEHLYGEALRVWLRSTNPSLVEPQAREAKIADSVACIARSVMLLARDASETPEWQEPLVAGTFDELLQAMRRMLEQVDPAREAVA